MGIPPTATLHQLVMVESILNVLKLFVLESTAEERRSVAQPLALNDFSTTLRALELGSFCILVPLIYTFSLSSAFCKPSTVCKTNDMVSSHVTCSDASSDTKEGFDNKNIFYHYDPTYSAIFLPHI